MMVKSEGTLAILLLWEISFGLAATYAGTSCILKNTNSIGICKALDECSSVSSDKKSGRVYTKCGYERPVEIVCCPLMTLPNQRRKRLCEQKCEEYQVTIDGLPNSGQCKISPSHFTGEVSVKSGEFSHIVLLGYDGEIRNRSVVCAGALISDQYVLTSAHCARSRLGEPRFARLGALSAESSCSSAQCEEVQVIETIPYPQYTSRLVYHDIALVKLSRKVVLNSNKRPACLPVTTYDVERHAIAVYYGSEPRRLQKLVMDVYTEDDCNEAYSTIKNVPFQHGVIANSQFCAGVKNVEESPTCNEAYDGPLQIQHPKLDCAYTLLGIGSFGVSCQRNTFPVVYTQVRTYIGWIERLIWADETNF